MLMLLLSIATLLSACNGASMRDYYSQKSNYVRASGTVIHIAYTDDHTELYLGFSDLIPQFDDVTFGIVGDNLTIVQQKGIDKKIKIGDQVDFITAPKYFGDGYVMPIVEISVNEEKLLDFEEGFANLLKWLE